VLAAYAVLPVRSRLVLPVVLVAVALWQPPVSVGDLRGAGDPAASADYFRPLLDELDRRQPVGRVEVVPTANYWDAAYVAGTVPLARGWLRQADIDRNPLFFDGSIDAARYQDWLRGNGVSLVAIADTTLSWVGRREADLIRSGLPYLTQVWRGEQWTLYAVAGNPSIVDGATLVSSTDRAVTVDVAAAGDVLVRVRWSRWLGLRGPGCLVPAADGWTTLRASAPGRYRLTSALRAGSRC
jgi:DNA-binding transcriptional LysR family regulator